MRSFTVSSSLTTLARSTKRREISVRRLWRWVGGLGWVEENKRKMVWMQMEEEEEEVGGWVGWVGGYVRVGGRTLEELA